MSKTTPMREAVQHIFFLDEDPVEENVCTICNQRITEFKNLSSEREYEISGMCQACQDEIFSDIPDEDRL